MPHRADDPTPGEGTPQEKQRGKTARYFAENSGVLLPLGTIAVVWFGMYGFLFNRIESNHTEYLSSRDTGRDLRSALTERVSLLEAAGRADRDQFRQALEEMRAARVELGSLHDVVIELRTEIQSQHHQP